jgi:hypothetical protein
MSWLKPLRRARSLGATSLRFAAFVAEWLPGALEPDENMN